MLGLCLIDESTFESPVSVYKGIMESAVPLTFHILASVCMIVSDIRMDDSLSDEDEYTFIRRYSC